MRSMASLNFTRPTIFQRKKLLLPTNRSEGYIGNRPVRVAFRFGYDKKVASELGD